jgi:hypothetical protein
MRAVSLLLVAFLLIVTCACSVPKAAPTATPTRLKSSPTTLPTVAATAEPGNTPLFRSSDLTLEVEQPTVTPAPTQAPTFTSLPTVTPSASLTPTIAATAKITVTTALKAKPSATKAPTKAATSKPSATKPPTRVPTLKPTPKPQTVAPTIAPTKAPSAEPTSAPTTALTLQIVSVTSPVKAGANATLRAKTVLGANCSITVYYKSGPGTASGLGPKTSDEQGSVSWTWKVGASTTPGVWRIVVTASKDGKKVTVETPFEVQ